MPRFVSAAAAVALLLVVLGPSAQASPAVLVHDRVDAQLTELDFCGSGLAVDVVVSGVQNLRLEADAFQGSGRFRAVITSAVTGRSVVVSSAGHVQAELVSGEPQGLHSHMLTFKGLPEKIQLAGGEVLLRDAGVIAFLDTFDGDQLIESAVVINRGPHPEADSDFSLFCSTILSALS